MQGIGERSLAIPKRNSWHAQCSWGNQQGAQGQNQQTSLLWVVMQWGSESNPCSWKWYLRNG